MRVQRKFQVRRATDMLDATANVSHSFGNILIRLDGIKEITSLSIHMGEPEATDLLKQLMHCVTRARERNESILAESEKRLAQIGQSLG